MRLVAWNANHNNKRRTLEQNVELLAAFSADVLVVSETAPPSDANPTGALWTGVNGWPGLAVVARTGLVLEPHGANPLSPPLMAGYRVSGRVGFNLLGIWPVQHAGGLTYSQILESALAQYSDLLSQQAIMAGDLNSSTSVSGQPKSHQRFVSAAEEIGLISAYHHQTGEDHGSESINTYRHNATQSFHIDYCFLSRSFVDAANLGIASGRGWSALSDHSPVVLDIPDAAFAPL